MFFNKEPEFNDVKLYQEAKRQQALKAKTTSLYDKDKFKRDDYPSSLNNNHVHSAKLDSRTKDEDENNSDENTHSKETSLNNLTMVLKIVLTIIAIIIYVIYEIYHLIIY
ncbi:MAG: hypothetical protein LBT75_05705 [Bacilli bacterium]|nr:hypothetical protein [Bacilli bacterium]